MIVRILRSTRIELTRVIRQRLFAGMLAAGFVFAALVTYFQTATDTDEFEMETTAFGCFLETMQHTSLILALAAFLLGALTVSQEVSGRTVQNWLLCPLRRSDLILGKSFGLGLLALFLFVTTGVVALGFAALAYDFTGVSMDGYELVSSSAMVENALIACTLSLMPLFAWCALGVAVSCLFRALAPALATAGFVFFALAFIQFAFTDIAATDLLFSSYTSRFLATAAEMSLGIADAYWDPDVILLGIVVPLASILVFLTLALLTFRRAELRG